MDILWRQNRRLSKNPTSEGPLTDLPDYSYIDGRPAQLGVSSMLDVSFSFNILIFHGFAILFPCIFRVIKQDV